ncbi:shikimate kinase [Riemerella anatipestifer]|nr:shikimate kinase [Riemerella anatipestifer]
MIISLIGYMGSGKSLISKKLSEKINFNLLDLDKVISEQEMSEIPQIFKEKGEIYFRKREKEILEHLLNTQKSTVFSLGGGTPVYYNNIDTINTLSESIYLRTSVKNLHKRLIKEKSSRPLIAHIKDNDQLLEFIAKHLFERQAYYSKAKYIVDTDDKSPDEIVNEIISLLNLQHH